MNRPHAQEPSRRPRPSAVRHHKGVAQIDAGIIIGVVAAATLIGTAMVGGKIKEVFGIASNAMSNDPPAQPAPPPPPALTPPSPAPLYAEHRPVVVVRMMPAAIYQRPYAASILPAGASVAAGGRWALSAGTLPGGLSVDPLGVLSGTPNTVEATRFEISTQGGGISPPLTIAATIAVEGEAPVIDSVPPPPFVVGQPYTTALVATTTPAEDGVNWTLVSGRLPEGLELSATLGTLSGTPVAEGSFAVVIQASDKITAASTTRSLVLVGTSRPEAAAVSAAPEAPAGKPLFVPPQVVAVELDHDAQAVDFRALLRGGGWDGRAPVVGTLTVKAGVWVGSNDPRVPALAVEGEFPAGSELTLINEGHIAGAGGRRDGEAGGTAVRATVPLRLDNRGQLWGGGGAGGRGGAATARSSSSNEVRTPRVFSGGAGGAGSSGRVPEGAERVGGVGPTGCRGGAGGAVGAAGLPGAECGQGGNGPGGAPGLYLDGSANVSWRQTGTRLGGVK